MNTSKCSMKPGMIEGGFLNAPLPLHCMLPALHFPRRGLNTYTLSLFSLLACVLMYESRLSSANVRRSPAPLLRVPECARVCAFERERPGGITSVHNAKDD